MKTRPCTAHCHGLVEVTVGQRDECVRAAQFHGGFLEVPARPGGHDRAGALAAGQRHAADAIVVDQQVDLILGGVQVRVGACRCTRLQEQLLEGGRRLRHVRGVLDHDHIAGHQVRAGYPRQLVVREVPGLHPEDDSQRGADQHGGVVGAGGVKRLGGQETLGLLGVVVQDLGAELNLAEGFGVKLAHLQGQQPGELVGPLAQDRRGTLDDGGALSERCLAPGLERLLRLSEQFHRLLVGQVVKGGHDLVVVRVHGLVCHGVASLQFTAAPGHRFGVVLASSGTADPRWSCR